MSCVHVYILGFKINLLLTFNFNIRIQYLWHILSSKVRTFFLYYVPSLLAPSTTTNIESINLFFFLEFEVPDFTFVYYNEIAYIRTDLPLYYNRVYLLFLRTSSITTPLLFFLKSLVKKNKQYKDKNFWENSLSLFP